MNFDQLIKFAVEQNASDLHFQTGAAPLLRINGQIRNVESPPLTNEVLRRFILSPRPKMTADELDLQLVQGLAEFRGQPSSGDTIPNCLDA